MGNGTLTTENKPWAIDMSFSVLEKQDRDRFVCSWHDSDGLWRGCKKPPYYLFKFPFLPWGDHAYCKMHGDRIIHRMPRQAWTPERKAQRQRKREEKRREAEQA
jgi:hypothetical protein